jgi:penicillin-binding protein 1B
MYKFWIKIVSLIFIFIFSAYLFYLNSIVKSQFSAEVEVSKTITQINYSFNEYPPELINMLLLVEDQSYFHHYGVDFK